MTHHSTTDDLLLNHRSLQKGGEITCIPIPRDGSRGLIKSNFQAPPNLLTQEGVEVGLWHLYC